MRLIAILGVAVLLFGVAYDILGRSKPINPYLACAGERIKIAGGGDKLRPFAEISAIRRWMDETAALGEGFDNWALAQARGLHCRSVGDLFQCRASARPCRAKRDKG